MDTKDKPRNTVYIDRPDSTMQSIAAQIGYKGKQYKLCAVDTLDYHSYWDGGSKDTYYVTELASKKTVGLPSNHPVFEAGRPDRINVIPGIAVTVHSIFCGKDSGLTFYVNPSSMNTLSLPEKKDISREMKIVLCATRNYKNTYAGQSNMRFKEAHRETGITESSWLIAKEECLKAGYLNTAGAITVAGRNVIGETNMYSLKQGV